MKTQKRAINNTTVDDIEAGLHFLKRLNEFYEAQSI